MSVGGTGLISSPFDEERPHVSYKTILVQLNNNRRAEAILEPAVDLASRFNAHLIGLHVQASVPVPALPLPFASSVLDKLAAQEHATSSAIQEIFSRAVARAALTPEWRLLKLSNTDVTSLVVGHARCADLVITGQTEPDWDMSPVFDFPERLALESGRPVLVVPHAGRHAKLGRNVVVAWKPTREAARAVFDALPLLKQAETVHILEMTEGDIAPGTLGADLSIAAALGRHGIKPIVHSSPAAGVDVGNALLSGLADLGADLLVMGAYGRSRKRELMFGGATREIARHMTVPTLFSH
jgi:nucleotide-binding universal stress UspA family protein